ncbi:hypothetical protein [Streptomyces sp. NBC_01334]|uniref:hypothetical protein n=1 Tax=Streptomyces sp. NBC_01334 TaxID=2903827 RepID=UPI002E14DA76|nr:hypothetical protein OG736_42705 [Streptomyces sp. NBC_01334]
MCKALLSSEGSAVGRPVADCRGESWGGDAAGVVSGVVLHAGTVSSGAAVGTA